MELEGREWINHNDVKILDVISETHYTPAGGEVQVHGGVTFSFNTSEVTNYDAETVDRILARKKAAETADYGYKLSSDEVQVGFMFNIYQNTGYSGVINLRDFFSRNGVSDLKYVTPSMVINCPNAEWRWSREPVSGMNNLDDDYMFNY